MYRRSILSISVDEYWNNLLLELKMMRAISQSHKMDNSIAFLMSPFLRFVNVAWLERALRGGTNKGYRMKCVDKNYFTSASPTY